MIIKTFVNNPFQENTYILSDQTTKECIIVDPGMNNDFEYRVVNDYLSSEGLILKAVWLTHSHVDHQMGTGFLAEDYQVPILGSIEDATQLPDVHLQSQLFGVHVGKQPVRITQNIKEGDKLKIGHTEVLVLDVPGHSYHSLCYYIPADKILLSGDVLFCCSVGRSDFGKQMGCNGDLLIEGIRSKLMTLPPDTNVYPGHGPSTTIQNEITYNPYF